MDEMPAIDALRDLLRRQLEAIERTEPGVRSGADPEDLHRFRVATRRSRALIRASRPLIGDQLSQLDHELRWLARRTGPIRDLDVLIERLQGLLDGLDPDQAGARSILGALERERLAQRQTLVHAIDSDRYGELVRHFGEALPGLEALDDELGLRRLAESELERLRADYAELGPDPSDDDLHALRITAKHARYAAELADRTEGPPLRALIDALRDLQDAIGAHQDAVVAELRVRALATADSALAVGRIVELERLARLEAREHVPEIWKRIRRAAEDAF